jgi:hypothetical protein
VKALAMNPSLFTQLPCASRSMGLALVVSLSLPAAHASTPTCRKADLRTPDYQKRTEMERCEGIRREKPIAADGLQLTSYTIGQASPQKGTLGGNVFTLQIPVGPPGLPEPVVAVKAWKGNYRMEPLRLGAADQGWKAFSWGAAVIQGQRIPSQQLRATALLRSPGDADQWLPVRFAPASSYSLVISSNGSLPIASVRIVTPDNKKVEECSGPTRMDQDLLCTWKAADLPRGTYLLRARDENGRMVLNETLLHDPRWLRR